MARPRPEDVRDLRALYDAQIRSVDSLLGKIFEALEQRRWLDSSIVIITADHGEQFYEHGQFMHMARHYNELLRVPLLIRLPGQRDAHRVTRQVGLLDVMPTLADLLDIPVPPDACTGVNFAPLLTATDSGPEDDRLYVSQSFHGAHDQAAGLDWHRLWRFDRRISFQNLRLKLIVDCSSGECRVFDLRTDPGEKNNLAAARPELADLARDLARLHLRSSERQRVCQAVPDAPGASAHG